MKLVVSAIAAAVVTAAPLSAQTVAAPGPTTSAPTPGTAATATRYSLDTPIETLVADPKAKTAVDTALGGDITKNPFYEQIKGLSFNQVQPLSQGQLTDDRMKKIGDALVAVK